MDLWSWLSWHSTGKTKVATFSSCKCKSAADATYTPLLPLLDGLTVGYEWPGNLSTALCANQYVLLVWLSTKQLSVSNTNVVDFKHVEMLTNQEVHALKGGQASMHFVPPSEDLQRDVVGSKLGIQYKHIMAINEWRLTVWIIQFYQQALEDP